MTRHFPRQHFLGSPLTRDYNYDWTRYFDAPKRYTADALARAYPGNFDVKVARIWREQSDVSESYYGYDNSSAALESQSNQIKAQTWARDLIVKYPDAVWLGSLRLLMVMYGTSPINPPQINNELAWQFTDGRYLAYAGTQFRPIYLPSRMKELKLAHELIQLAARQAQLEPDNAFPLLMGAQLLLQERRIREGTDWLHRAARCKRYDDHSTEIAAAVLRSYEMVRPLSVLEQSNVLSACFTRRYQINLQSHTNLAALAGHYQAELLRRHDGKAALNVAEDMLAAARLVQTGRSVLNRRNSVVVMTHLALFGWFPSGGKRWKPIPIESSFARYCATHGLKARGQRLLAARQQVLHGYSTTPEYYPSIYSSATAKKVETLMTVGMVFLGHGAFVLVIWLGVAMLLFRGIGPPSRRRDRVFVVLPCMLLSGGLSLVVWWWEANQPGRTVTSWKQEGVMASLAVFAALLPVFAPILLCTAGTWSRYRPLFALPERMATELKLTRYQTGLMRRTLPVIVILVCSGLILSWALWAVASWNSWAPMDLLSWIPFPSATLAPTLWFTPTEPLPLAYFMGLTLLISLLWLAKWLWLTAPHGRPATHFGVRWFKECLSAYIIGLAWLYFFTALIAWPISNQARAEWEHRVQAATAVVRPA